uniref:Uncharacterized protein AlNc14C453G11744 n=1 Tax=Albugo laibachii Nc14 TaxID=890382 RepID=F0X003_9STRA|nr:conserved hypothetical protein [Albugo laibachii Nc14]|eukprot:CCA27084.1 conserved hypothetical protein [Albugo laibachii Nc14]
MNKEVLERGFADMKEKSRGGLSKGMSFLRSAAASHVLNTTANGIETDQQTQQDSTENGTLPATNGEKPSYDQLLSLSMKLTRQNKLMKAQMQKSQTQIQGFIALQTNYETLSTFVKDSVGIDLSLCGEEDSNSSADSKSILRNNRLEELYASKLALDAKNLRKEMDESQKSVASVPSQAVDARSTVASNEYDEIDLFSALSPRASTANKSEVYTSNDLVETTEKDELVTLRRRLEELKETLEQSNQEKRALEDKMRERQSETGLILLKLSEANEKLKSSHKAFDESESVLYGLLPSISEALVEQLEAIASSTVTMKKLQHDKSDEAIASQCYASELSETNVQHKGDSCVLSGDTGDLDIVEQLCTAVTQFKEVCGMANEEILSRAINREGLLAGTRQTWADQGNNLEEKMGIVGRREEEAMPRQLITAEEGKDQHGNGMRILEDRLLGIMNQNERLRRENEKFQLAMEESTQLTQTQLEKLRQHYLEVMEETQELNRKLVIEKDYFQNKLEILAGELDEACRRNEIGTAKLEETHANAEEIIQQNVELTTKNTYLTQEVDDLRDDLDTATKALESHAELAEKEGDLRKKSEAIQESLERENIAIRDELTKELESVKKEKNATITRFQQERNAVTEKLNEVSIQNEEHRWRSEALQTSLSKSDALVQELEAHLSEISVAKAEVETQLSETKKSLSEKLAFATRLQTEHMGIAGKHAEQAAIIENALREAATANNAKRDAEANLEVLRETMNEVLHDRDEALRQKRQAEDEMEALKRRLSDQLIEVAQQHQIAMENEKKKMQIEIARIEMEGKTKSKLARHVVSEKESEIKILQTRVAELEEDVRSGGADHRKILEFAQLQACRDAESIANASEIQHLHHKLATKEDQMQTLVEDLTRKDKELARMMQNQRRDGVNMEYLKNIIVQYITFRPGSSQQRRLLPVISTLLQFTHGDLKEIKSACGRRSSWSSWAAIEKHKPLTSRSLSKLSNSDHPETYLTPTRAAHGQETTDASQRLSMLADIRETGTLEASPTSSRASSFDLPSGLQHYVDAEDASPLHVFESTDF